MIKILIGYLLGVTSIVLATFFYKLRQENVEKQAKLNIIAAVLDGIEIDGIYAYIIQNPKEIGTFAVKIEDIETDEIFYAKANRLGISLINPLQWAHLATLEGVAAVPSFDGYSDDDYD